MSVKIQKPLAVISAVMMTMLLVVSAAVPAFAAETATSTTDSNPQIVYDEPNLGEDDTSDNGITLPEAPEKEGYTFQGWRVNGGSDLYDAGDVVVKNDSAELHLQPVYKAATGVTTEDKSVSSNEEEPDLLNQYEDGSDIVLQYGHDNILTLPDAKKKEGYDFYGWCVNGNTTDLYKSGSTIPVKAGEKVTLTPVYCSIFRSRCAFWGGICFAIFFTLFILRAFGDNSREKEIVLNILITISVMASSFLITASSLPSLTP